MKAIIIEDKDCKALLDKMKLESMETDIGYLVERDHAEWSKIPESTKKQIISNLHRKFHYHLVKWLTDQGGSVL